MPSSTRCVVCRGMFAANHWRDGSRVCVRCVNQGLDKLLGEPGKVRVEITDAEVKRYYGNYSLRFTLHFVVQSVPPLENMGFHLSCMAIPGEDGLPEWRVLGPAQSVVPATYSWVQGMLLDSEYWELLLYHRAQSVGKVSDGRNMGKLSLQGKENCSTVGTSVLGLY